MIAWSIEAAFNSSCFDEVLVSTDDEEIARIAKDYGANVPFVRPKELSDDYATTQEVIEHSIKWLLKKNIWGAYETEIYNVKFYQPIINQYWNLLNRLK